MLQFEETNRVLERDITERKRAEEAREKFVLKLQDAPAKVKTLSGMLPICASCNKEGTMSNPVLDLLISALLDGDQAQAVAEAKKLRDAGVGYERIITVGVEAAMTQLDAKCTVEQFNLLEIMLVGRAVTVVMKELYPPGSPLPQTKGTVVIASLEGDVHDLGKNIVKMVLTGKGYWVVDCGRSCSVEKLVETTVQEAAQVIGISGLITTVIPQVRQVRDRMAERGLGHIKVMAGGAALKQAAAESLNVDFVAETAFDGARYLDRILERSK